jgi:hypothetical protein
MKIKRTPVLAHERFVADRANFQGLELAARFERIARTNLWGAETTKSGRGSESEATTAISAELTRLLARLEVRSLLDAPCGEIGWIVNCVGDVDYTGVDIVPALTAANIARAKRNNFVGRFVTADITRDALPRADLILCRDCLVHLSFENIHRAVTRLKASGSNWLLTTTFPLCEANSDCEDGDWRPLNMEIIPFCWPATPKLINEGCKEGDGGWCDKSLGLWSLADVPDEYVR